MDKNLEKLNTILTLLEEDKVTQADFKQFFELFTQVVASLKDEINNRLTDIEGPIVSNVLNKLNEFRESMEMRMSEHLSSKTNRSELASLALKMDADINSVKSLIPTVPSLEPISSRVLEVEAKNTKQDDELEGLRKEIAKLREEIAANKVISTGGVSNMRITQAFKYILKTEEPVGDIDGVNTTYRVSQPIFAILSMSLNGETIAQLPNYTISANTFTFSTALPAAYANKDWEVKYI